ISGPPRTCCSKPSRRMARPIQTSADRIGWGDREIVEFPTQAALDEQFSLDRVKNLDALFARRAQAAEQACARFEMVPAISYGPHPVHRLNIFPAAGEPGPVQVFIHGGFWRSLDANLFSFLAPGFVPFGATLVVIDYPLMPVARMSDVVHACQMSL